MLNCLLGFMHEHWRRIQPRPFATLKRHGSWIHPNDDGSSVTIQWDAAPEDSGISGYQILRRIAGGGLEEIGGMLPAGATSYVDASIEKGERLRLRRACRE